MLIMLNTLHLLSGQIWQKIRINFTEGSSSSLPSLWMLAQHLSLAELMAGQWQKAVLLGASEKNKIKILIIYKNGKEEACIYYTDFTFNIRRSRER